MQILKKVEGQESGKEWQGVPINEPHEGEPFAFAHDHDDNGAPRQVYVTSPVRSVTDKTERTIIRTQHSVYSLEKNEDDE